MCESACHRISRAEGWRGKSRRRRKTAVSADGAGPAPEEVLVGEAVDFDEDEFDAPEDVDEDKENDLSEDGAGLEGVEEPEARDAEAAA